MGQFGQKEVKAAGIMEDAKTKLATTDPFFRDTKLNIHLRNYEYYRDNGNDSINQTWAMGADVEYQSGWYRDLLSVGSVLSTAFPFYAPSDEDGAGLLKTHQQAYAVISEIYGQVKVIPKKLELNLFRYHYNTPYLNKNDTAMTPNTFEGYTFRGSQEDGRLKLNYGGGYVDKIKEQNSDKFVSMSRAAGAATNRGVWTGGFNAIENGFSLGMIDYYSQDIINIAYLEAKFSAELNNKVGLNVAGQSTHQQSVGEDLLMGNSFSTNQYGGLVEASCHGGILSFAYTRDAHGQDLQTPWGGYAGYTSVQVNSFNHAGEQAFLSKVSYDFKRVGWDGFVAYALFVHGWGRVNPDGMSAVPNVNELNLDLQWRPRWKAMKNLWLRARYANAAQYGPTSTTTNDFRFIANYNFSLL